MTGKGIIRLSDALALMEQGEPFNLVHFTADERKQTGGQRKVRLGVKLTSSGKKAAGVQGTAVVVPAGESSQKRNPNHFENATRNIQLVNGQTRKVHIFLITQFNGLKVII